MTFFLGSIICRLRVRPLHANFGFVLLQPAACGMFRKAQEIRIADLYHTYS
jgi:hypothetical protein